MALAFIDNVERVVGVPARMYFNIELQIHICFSVCPSLGQSILDLKDLQTHRTKTQRISKNTKNYSK